MNPLHPGLLQEVAVLGAHCDDIAIGCGATLQLICRARPGLTVRALVLTGGSSVRADEEHAALSALCGPASVHLTVLDLPDGRVPEHFAEAKDAVAGLRDDSDVDLVLAPHAGDAHQDHRLLGEITPTIFRDHPVLGYEVLKWESDLPRTTLYQPLSAADIDDKLQVLRTCYPSQAGHDWFDDEAFRGLARLRGVQCRAPYAEGFVTDKLTLDLSSPSRGRDQEGESR
ncbi:PIG-L family deacetylase [Flexivirga sp. ID2601S]|uniref:PIG-L family deacetylase n=1 Tax=Flexivirga aerilata TaxID=1656889 RepID=A0A849AJH3_9MICO|nr:PIG-L deacetylase family protein [Flexivirga aerilata]NNG38550.1 PIG-L family deacetylase [Flexivirga aerilata]